MCSQQPAYNTMQNITKSAAQIKSLYFIMCFLLGIAIVAVVAAIEERAKRIELQTLNELIIKNADPFAIVWAHTRMDYPLLTDAEVAILANFRANRIQLK